MGFTYDMILLSTLVSSSSCFLQHRSIHISIPPSDITVSPARNSYRIMKDQVRPKAKALWSSTLEKNEEIENRSRSTPRLLAAKALVQKKKQIDLDAVSRLESSPDFLKSSQRDKAFARNLVSTTSRRLGQIDHILSKCCDSYPPKGGQGQLVQSCLRIGTVQLLFLDTPAFAAVKETVDVLKDKNFLVSKKLVSFANAVLRRVQREGAALLLQTDDSDNISDFLKEEFTNLYGEENTKEIVGQLLDDEAHNNVDLSLKDADITVQDVIDAFESDGDDRFASISVLPNGSIRIKKGPNAGAISDWPLYHEGAWWVQDVASTLPAIALTEALRKKHGKKLSMNELRVVDMCSAPGGKAAQLLAADFQVTAIEANARRSRRLLENLERLKFGEDRCQVVVSPGQEWLPGHGESDEDIEVAGVLVDVPCSATGTGNKRPDVLRKDGDLGNLLETQEILANHCADNVLKSGGVMVYATCSLLARESEDQVSKLLQKGKMKTLPFEKGEIKGFDDAIDENGWLRVLPGVLGGELSKCDGFFVARLEKI